MAFDFKKEYKEFYMPKNKPEIVNVPMHIGSFDNEPATVALMDAYLEQNGYVNDINKDRLHHEIYMSDARKAAPEKWKTVIRHPIKKA